ncbi:MAG: putative manganese-dependent inorganic diphosphatase [Spirochaetes bacterium]|nr:putative manganese-dependent inorganic diphosphatase [Spirochaetota bacterium]
MKDINKGREEDQNITGKTMDNDRKIYVIGHRNPDADSIVSSIAYAEFKRLQGYAHCFPVAAGKINPQTKYILERFNVPEPEFLSDLIPKVSAYMSREPLTIHKDASLWDALELLNSSGHKMLPIVDENGCYNSTLHYNAFAKNVLKKVNPHSRPVIPTSLNLLSETINGELVSSDSPASVFNAQIVVAASDMDSVKAHSSTVPKENCIIMVGNRKEVQDYVIESQYHCLIVTGKHSITKEQAQRAKENGVSVILSPYDTVTTSTLALYSTPVSYMSDYDITPLTEERFIKDVKWMISESASRALPVIDEENRVIGVISQGNLVREPNIDIIMVDHNESSQAIAGIEHYHILEIIDHHKLGNIYTNNPITFINKPVGSTATIVSGLYLSNKLTPSKEIASILLSGILSDTLVLRSATATAEDKEMAEFLSGITGLDITTLGSDIMYSSSAVAGKSALDIISMDMKKYDYNGKGYSVSQIEVASFNEIQKRKDEISEAMAALRSKEDLLFAALMITDITDLDSLLLIIGDHDFIKEVHYPKFDNNTFIMKGVVSRKKQLMPYLIDLLKKSL